MKNITNEDNNKVVNQDNNFDSQTHDNNSDSQIQDNNKKIVRQNDSNIKKNIWSKSMEGYWYEIERLLNN